jgi:hypothetical protein
MCAIPSIIIVPLSYLRSADNTLMYLVIAD